MINIYPEMNNYPVTDWMGSAEGLGITSNKLSHIRISCIKKLTSIETFTRKIGLAYATLDI